MRLQREGWQEEVAQWLDDEWIERSVHRDIGSLAGKLIEEARRAGDQVRSLAPTSPNSGSKSSLS